MKILISFLILVVCISGFQDGEGSLVVNEKNIEVTRHCVGRVFFDLPASLTSSPLVLGIIKEKGLGPQESSIDINISTSEISILEYLRLTERRENEIREMAGDDIKVLRAVRKIGDTISVFRIQEMDDAYVSEVSALIDGAMVVARLDSYNNQFEQAEERLISLLSLLKSSKTRVERGGNGFCLGRLILAGDFEIETGQYSFLDKKGTRVNFDVDTYAPNENVDLLSRVSGPKSLLTIFKVDHTVLRARELNVAGMRAQEWLSWAILRDNSDVRTHTFELETMRSTPDKNKPLISVTLRTAQPQGNGVYAKTSASDEETVRLWDSIVTSIQAFDAKS